MLSRPSSTVSGGADELLRTARSMPAGFLCTLVLLSAGRTTFRGVAAVRVGGGARAGGGGEGRRGVRARGGGAGAGRGAVQATGLGPPCGPERRGPRAVARNPRGSRPRPALRCLDCQAEFQRTTR